MKRLAEQAPDLNIFSAKLIIRDALGWEITKERRRFLSALEKAVADQSGLPRSTIDPSSNEVAAQTVTDATKSLIPARTRRQSTRRRRRKGGSNRHTA
ncbi:hypothetical protein [Bradyrhizobium sp. 33ap4]|uniref:hypothetical protein n=1 Tax=Bradyrhizobium sp. 33ap4 TaxID=3061630 RepID=UPI00292EDE81|nr:hypothetical protein [Bradyrhizobium sp. 33ap4]